MSGEIFDMSSRRPMEPELLTGREIMQNSAEMSMVLGGLLSEMANNDDLRIVERHDDECRMLFLFARGEMVKPILEFMESYMQDKGSEDEPETSSN